MPLFTAVCPDCEQVRTLQFVRPGRRCNSCNRRRVEHAKRLRLLKRACHDLHDCLETLALLSTKTRPPASVRWRDLPRPSVRNLEHRIGLLRHRLATLTDQISEDLLNAV